MEAAIALLVFSLIGLAAMVSLTNKTEKAEVEPAPTLDTVEEPDLAEFLVQFGDRYMAAQGRAKIGQQRIELAFRDHVEVLDWSSGEMVWSKESWAKAPSPWPTEVIYEEQQYADPR